MFINTICLQTKTRYIGIFSIFVCKATHTTIVKMWKITPLSELDKQKQERTWNDWSYVHIYACELELCWCKSYNGSKCLASLNVSKSDVLGMYVCHNLKYAAKCIRSQLCVSILYTSLIEKILQEIFRFSSKQAEYNLNALGLNIQMYM